MSDLNFNQLQNEASCPLNSFVMISGKPYLDIGVFINESVADLSAPKVTEVAVKLCRVANAAQTAVNTTRTSGNKVNSFPSPSFSPPSTNASGVIQARITCSVQGNMGVNDADISPLFN
jgi:hypothetical protein